MAAVERVGDRQMMAQQSWPQPVIGLVGKAALIIVDPATEHEIVKVANTVIACIDAQQVDHTGIEGAIDQSAMERPEKRTGESPGKAPALPCRLVQGG
jgi:hypothetical protein